MLHDIGQHVSRKGHHRHAAYLVENAQLRGFEPSEIDFLADARAPPPARRPEAVRTTLRCAVAQRTRSGCASSRRSCASPTGSTAGVVVSSRICRADVGADLVILRLRARGDAELALWGARRRRDLFEQVFGREIEFAITATENV